MAETHNIERKGLQALEEHLRGSGRSVVPSPDKTFDRVVDGVPAEVKCKQLPWARLDFVGLTDNQRAALDRGERFSLFIVCNLASDGSPEIIEIPSERLLGAEFKIESTHYLYGPQLRRLNEGLTQIGEPRNMPHVPLSPDWLAAQSARLTVLLIHDFTDRKLSAVDQLVISAMNRAAAMAQGFHLLYNDKNFISASALVRLQLDNGLRAFGLMMADGPNNAARKVMAGERLDRLADRHGTRLTDARIVKQLEALYPSLAVQDLYERGSSYVHLSDEAYRRTWEVPDNIRPGAKASVRVGDPGAFLSDEEWGNLLGDFELATDVIVAVIKAWAMFRTQAGGRGPMPAPE